MMRKPLCRFALPVFGLAIALAVWSGSLQASALEIQAENVNSGEFAARISVASACEADLHTFVADPVAPGPYVGCSTLTSDGDLASGAASFTAGDRVILRSGFSVLAATLTVEIDRPLYPDAWVQDDTPDGETIYAAAFFVDLSQLVLSEESRFYHFIAFDAGGAPELRIGVKGAPGLAEKRLFLEVFEDDGGIVSTEGLEELVVPDGWHFIDIGWQSGTEDQNGFAYLCVDSPEPPLGCATLSGLDNDTGAIDFVRWGAIDVPSQSDLGVLDLDDFRSESFSDGFDLGTSGAWSATSQD